MTIMAAEGGGAAAASSRGAATRQSRPTGAQMGRGGPIGGQARAGAQGARGPRGPSGRPAAGTRTRTTAQGSVVSSSGGGSKVTTGPPRGGKPSSSPQQARQRLQPRPQPPPKRSQSKRRAAAGRITGASTKPGSTLHNYQAIIAAEYVTATLLVAISPIATRQAQVSPTSGKLSPYLPTDIIKILAIGIVYLILEGLAAGPRGLARFSAWFGGLILLAVGLSELAHIAEIFKVIAGSRYNPVKLTGAQAPQTKGNVQIPPLGQGSPSSSTPPKGG